MIGHIVTTKLRDISIKNRVNQWCGTRKLPCLVTESHNRQKSMFIFFVEADQEQQKELQTFIKGLTGVRSYSTLSSEET